MRVFAMWHGGHSYSFGERELDMITFESIADAKRYLPNRFWSGYWDRSSLASVVNFDEDDRATVGVHEDVLHPAVDATTYMDLYGADVVGTDDQGRTLYRVHEEPFRRLTLGPRHGVRSESF